MKDIIVEGKKCLNGSVEIPGAKNSALPLIAASVLFKTNVTLCNVPNLSDVKTAIEILNVLGCKTRFNKKTLSINASSVVNTCIPENLMQTMRSSLFFLAPILVRKKKACITTPGGCKLGSRPIDIHLDGLESMGAKVVCNDLGEITLTAKNGLKGTDFTLKFPSVGATETLIMAAVLATGKSVLRGVAKEPEIEDLIRFLQSGGAKIAGAKTDVLYIEGVKNLHEAQHTVCPDRITTSTVMCAVAACGGEVLVLNCNPEHVSSVFSYLNILGCQTINTGANSICVSSGGPKCGIGNVFTDIYPAFSTDAAPILMAACLRAKGQSVCTDTIFENRFACAKEFNALGANAKTNANKIIINGAGELYGAKITAHDLRGGAALVVAAMQANGISKISNTHFIARGYEDIVTLFNVLGANIRYE